MGKVSELPKLFHPDFSVPGRRPVGPVVVDWNNPLSRGLVAVWIFRNKSALVREFTLNTLEGNAHFDPVEGLKLDGTGDAFRTTDRTLHSGEISIIASGVINNTGSSAQIFCSDDTTGGREFQFKKNPSNKLQFTSFVGGSPVATSSAASLSAGSQQTYGCSFSKNGSGNVKIYIDGLNDGSGTNSGALDNVGGPATLGARFSASSLSDEINGSLSYVFVWDRVVSPAEQLSIHKNPYQILKPATPSFFIVPDAGGATLVVQDMAQGQSLQSPALTQAHVLTVNGVVHGQALASSTLSTGVDLSVNSFVQSQSLTSPALLQAHILVVDDLGQAQLLAEPGLLQAHQLIVSALQQAHAIESPALSQANSLTLNSVQQSQALGSPTLAQAHILTVDNVSQAQALEGALLSIAGSLAVADTAQGQSLGLPVLTQAHGLSVADMEHAQSLAAPSLVQSSALSVDSIVQSQVFGNVSLSTADALAVSDVLQLQVFGSPSLDQANVLSVEGLTQSQLMSIISLGGAVVTKVDGRVVIYSAYSGEVSLAPGWSGNVNLH